MRRTNQKKVIRTYINRNWILRLCRGIIINAIIRQYVGPDGLAARIEGGAASINIAGFLQTLIQTGNKTKFLNSMQSEYDKIEARNFR